MADNPVLDNSRSNNLKKWTGRKIMEFNKRNYKVLHLKSNDPSNRCRLRKAVREVALQERTRDLGGKQADKSAICSCSKDQLLPVRLQ